MFSGNSLVPGRVAIRKCRPIANENPIDSDRLCGSLPHVASYVLKVILGFDIFFCDIPCWFQRFFLGGGSPQISCRCGESKRLRTSCLPATCF